MSALSLLSILRVVNHLFINLNHLLVNEHLLLSQKIVVRKILKMLIQQSHCFYIFCQNYQYGVWIFVEKRIHRYIIIFILFQK